MSTSDEVAKAQSAADAAADGDTIFGKIARGEIPTQFLYEDDQVTYASHSIHVHSQITLSFIHELLSYRPTQCVAFDDIGAQAPVHFLVIPRKRIAQLSAADAADEQLLGHLLLVAARVARDVKHLHDGFRVVVNDGRVGAQSVYHLHVHVLIGRQMGECRCRCCSFTAIAHRVCV